MQAGGEDECGRSPQEWTKGTEMNLLEGEEEEEEDERKVEHLLGRSES